MTSWPEFRPDFPYKGKKSVLDISVQGVGRLHLWNVFKTPKYFRSSTVDGAKGWIYYILSIVILTESKMSLQHFHSFICYLYASFLKTVNY